MWKRDLENYSTFYNYIKSKIFQSNLLTDIPADISRTKKIEDFNESHFSFQRRRIFKIFESICSALIYIYIYFKRIFDKVGTDVYIGEDKKHE